MSVHKTKSGTWRVMWRDEDGRPRQRNFKRKKDADRVDLEIRRAKTLTPFGFTLEEKPMTLADLYEDWRRNYGEPKLAAHTMDSYKSIWHAQIESRLGNLEVRQITAKRCEDFAGQLAHDKVGPAAQAKALAVLSSLLRRAVVAGQLDHHPMRGTVRVPQPRRASGAIVPPGPEAIWTIADRFEHGEDAESRILILLLGFAGLRPEEALALDWREVGKRTLTIQWAIAKGERKRTKTERTRTVELLPALERELVAYRLHQGLPSEGLLIARTDGKPWRDTDYRNWRTRRFKPTAAGLATKPYELRHAFASLLLHEGRSVIEVAAQLGHSPSVCLDTYGHVIAELAGARRVKAATAVERARKATRSLVERVGSTLARGEEMGTDS